MRTKISRQLFLFTLVSILLTGCLAENDYFAQTPDNEKETVVVSSDTVDILCDYDYPIGSQEYSSNLLEDIPAETTVPFNYELEEMVSIPLIDSSNLDVSIMNLSRTSYWATETLPNTARLVGTEFSNPWTTTTKKESTKTVTTQTSKATTTTAKVSKKPKKPKESTATTTDSKNLETRKVLDVKNIQQLPELPAGCEITSTTIVLNHLGFDIDKMTLMKNYMPMMKWKDKNGRWESPWNVFVGSPELTYYGCYSPVIKKTINAYFADKKVKDYEVVDLSGSTVKELYKEIDNGNPVLVWATIKMSASKKGNSWILQDGSKYTWIAGEHCLVLIGYDTKNDTVILSDPYDKRGTVEYSRETFEKRYNELFQQALVVKKQATKNQIE